MNTDVLTRRQVADMFHVHPMTVTKWAQKGLLPFFWLPGNRVRKFYRADVEAWLAHASSEKSA